MNSDLNNNIPSEENIALWDLDFIDKYFRFPESINPKISLFLELPVWLFCLFITFLVGEGEWRSSLVVGIGVGVLIASRVSALYVYKSEKPKRIKRKYKILQDAQEIIDRHFSALHMNFLRLMYQDEYGYWHDKGWDKELNYFLENVFLNEVSKNVLDSIKDPCFEFKYLRFFVDYFYAKVQKEEEFFLENRQNEIMTGEDFEDFIRDILQQRGFNVKKTPKTGDQGVDLIVRTDTDKIAVQCKYYSRPVGNKAVQEVAAGKTFYKCNKAVVVSNQSYTISAQKLARSSGVELLNEKSIISYLESDIDA